MDTSARWLEFSILPFLPHSLFFFSFPLELLIKSGLLQGPRFIEIFATVLVFVFNLVVILDSLGLVLALLTEKPKQVKWPLSLQLLLPSWTSFLAEISFQVRGCVARFRFFRFWLFSIESLDGLGDVVQVLFGQCNLMEMKDFRMWI